MPTGGEGFREKYEPDDAVLKMCDNPRCPDPRKEANDAGD
jgi:hypothetical protein